MSRTLGMDYGDRRIGLSLSDEGRTFARPLATLRQGPGFFEELRVVVAEHEVDRVILGLPRNMDGTLGPKAQQVLRFQEELERASGLPVETWDERLTTVEAARILAETGMSRRKKKEKTDQVAAQILLQSYLDAHRGD